MELDLLCLRVIGGKDSYFALKEQFKRLSAFIHRRRYFTSWKASPSVWPCSESWLPFYSLHEVSSVNTTICRHLLMTKMYVGTSRALLRKGIKNVTEKPTTRAKPTCISRGSALRLQQRQQIRPSTAVFQFCLVMFRIQRAAMIFDNSQLHDEAKPRIGRSCRRRQPFQRQRFCLEGRAHNHSSSCICLPIIMFNVFRAGVQLIAFH